MKITEYDQLKHGMKVKVTCISVLCGDVPVEGVVSINRNGEVFVCHDNEQVHGHQAEDKLGYKNSWRLYRQDKSVVDDHKDLETRKKTLDDLEEGDILVEGAKVFRLVLGVCGQVVFTTSGADGTENFTEDRSAYTWSVVEMKQRGFTVYQPEETEEIIVTLDDIAKLKGVDVSKIKIKK